MWASPEEQAWFVDRVNAADWSFMGRITHEQAPRRDRRRVIFSTGANEPEWRQPWQLWVDPATTDLSELLAEIDQRHPARDCIVLGGTRVHDWFLEHWRPDSVTLSIEPLEFGSGMKLFSFQTDTDPDAIMNRLDYVRVGQSASMMPAPRS